MTTTANRRFPAGESLPGVPREYLLDAEWYEHDMPGPPQPVYQGGGLGLAYWYMRRMGITPNS